MIPPADLQRVARLLQLQQWISLQPVGIASRGPRPGYDNSHSSASAAPTRRRAEATSDQVRVSVPGKRS